jgi:hypothetical protein
VTPDQYERLALLVAQESAAVKGILRSMDARMGRMEGRQDTMDGRLDTMDGRLDKMDGRFDGMDGRFDGIESRLSRVEVTGEEARHLLELVAEGVTTVDRKVETLRLEMTQGFTEVREEMAVGFGANDGRLGKLESGSTA